MVTCFEIYNGGFSHLAIGISENDENQVLHEYGTYAEKNSPSLHVKLRGRPPKRVKEANLETLTSSCKRKELDNLGTETIDNQTNMLQAASNGSNIGVQIRMPSGVNLMEEVNPNELPFEATMEFMLTTGSHWQPFCLANRTLGTKQVYSGSTKTFFRKISQLLGVDLCEKYGRLTAVQPSVGIFEFEVSPVSSLQLLSSAASISDGSGHLCSCRLFPPFNLSYIAAILDGVHITGYDICRDNCYAVQSEVEKKYGSFDIGELKASLQRRGPDSLGSRTVLVQLDCGISVEKSDDKLGRSRNPCPCCMQNIGGNGVKSVAQLDFIGSTLQLRGLSPVSQPLADTSGNILVYNGEIFGGMSIIDDSNDSEALLHALKNCGSDPLQSEMYGSCGAEHGNSIPEVLLAIEGPWALIYWQEKSKTIWFGRDAFGRRSLLVHWPSWADPRFILSSVAPPSSIKYFGSNLKDESDNEMVSEVSNATTHVCYWEELPCGIYSIEFKLSSDNEHDVMGGMFGEVRKHKRTNALLNKIVSWDRVLVDPKTEHAIPLQKEQLHLATNCSTGACYHIVPSAVLTEPAERVLFSLRKSVMKRATMSINFQTAMEQWRDEEMAPVAVLFSGGLDSMILAALLNQCLNPHYIIDLLNVSFDGQLAPDRISARLGLRELQNVAPSRRWRLVEIDATLSTLTKETSHVMSLIHPANTYMDLNIGLSLWLAASGDGWVDERYRYKSHARVLLVGSGADEQCAGYGRHRTKYKLGGWDALHEEMKLDMQRIWKRNLGRDDRLISDHGKEARFPFLDEEVIQTMLEIPLWDIANLDEPAGIGDKKILREVARLLHLQGAAVMPKRAIQFGSRIARESNRKNFGSNRAANQVSAGSVIIKIPE
ncbi:hypothetical protein HPP92_001825 [Vanilla planifolia]|uniref:Asparagine synthetase domain-containing protein 1 n=1 Tax=Vanilla planifolia TaxID=51239 RepID=A0A835RSC2_VANPL|nr:hypothetical protein HPP92_001825 [Vanilla planifolia]